MPTLAQRMGATVSGPQYCHVKDYTKCYWKKCIKHYHMIEHKEWESLGNENGERNFEPAYDSLSKR